MKATAVVFKKGDNRFLNPLFWWPDEERPAGWLVDAMMYSLQLGIDYEPDLMELEVDEGALLVPHVRTTISGPQLLHGRGTIWMISGPLFDECRAAAA